MTVKSVRALWDDCLCTGHEYVQAVYKRLYVTGYVPQAVQDVAHVSSLHVGCCLTSSSVDACYEIQEQGFALQRWARGAPARTDTSGRAPSARDTMLSTAAEAGGAAP